MITFIPFSTCFKIQSNLSINPKVDSLPFAAAVAHAVPLQYYQVDLVHQPLGLRSPVFKDGRVETRSLPGQDNQYKLLFTLFAIGYLGVSGKQWETVSSLVELLKPFLFSSYRS